MISIQKQLRRYFIAAAAVSILVIFVIANIGMNYFFKEYLKESQIRADQRIVTYLEDLYMTTGSLEAISSNLMPLARREGIEVRLYNTNAQLLVDTTKMMMPGHGMGMGRGPNMNQGGSTDIDPSDLVYREYTLYLNNQKIGKLEIGRERTVLSSAEDKSFFYTMNTLFVVSLVLALLIAGIFSGYVSRKFLKPLLAIKQSIVGIARGQEINGNYNFGTAELSELYQATQDLSVKLKEQNKLRKRLTSDIAHELRTPLATLQSHLEAMVDGVWEPTPERLSYCNDEILRLTGLIKNLSELSGIEEEDITLNKKEVDLTKHLTSMVDSFKPMFMGKDIELNSDIQEQIFIYGDKDRLNQIFVNLLSNAFKYTREKGQVTVNLKKSRQKAVVEIIDNGIGIPPKDLKYIFERLYRGDLSRSRESGGSGIGLTIAKAFTEAHHGTIDIQSEIDQGTKVTVSFDLINPGNKA